MVEPELDDIVVHPVVTEGVFEQLEPTIELSPHDAVRSVRHWQRTARVFFGSPQVTCRERQFVFFEPRLVHVSEEKANHDVARDPIDEVIDDRSKAR